MGALETDLAAEVRRLKAETRKQRWVSVDDRLPPSIKNRFFNWVLVWDEQYEVNMALWRRDKWMSRLGDELPNVTHWMPLPCRPTSK